MATVETGHVLFWVRLAGELPHGEPARGDVRVEVQHFDMASTATASMVASGRTWARTHSLAFFTMGRTVHYKIHCKEEEIERAWPEIEHVQSMMNERFTWTCERLSLRPTDDEDRRAIFDSYYLAEHRITPTAWGFTKVASDDWNAALVFRFFAWVSSRIPRARITVNDEGPYVPVGYLAISGGRWAIDMEDLQRNRDYLVESELWKYAAEQVEAVARFMNGQVFAPIPVIDYADRQEIRALGLPNAELARMTLDQVANLIRFPWESAERP